MMEGAVVRRDRGAGSMGGLDGMWSEFYVARWGVESAAVLSAFSSKIYSMDSSASTLIQEYANPARYLAIEPGRHVCNW